MLESGSGFDWDSDWDGNQALNSTVLNGDS